VYGLRAGRAGRPPAPGTEPPNGVALKPVTSNEDGARTFAVLDSLRIPSSSGCAFRPW